MKKNGLLFVIALTFILVESPVLAQEEAAPPTPAEQKAAGPWDVGAGMGFDFAQLLQINPKQGAGQNRLGIGGAANVFANYKLGRHRLQNKASWQFGLQRLGSGVVAQGTDESPIPFQKAIDELRLSTKYGFRVSPESKWLLAVNGTLFSQLTPTYQGSDTYPGNFLMDVFETGQTPLSKLFSPATLTLSVGIDYQPNDNWSFFYSPLGAKWIIVGNDDIAALGVHGNPIMKDDMGTIIAFENIDGQLGSLLRGGYENALIDEKISFSSALLLYSNYLRNPQNIDLDWANQLDVNIVKNLAISVLVNTFYDDDVRVQITDYDAPNGVNGLGKRVSITQQLLIKYKIVF
ncbi:MAG: DUF3078 domain-containing protein [Lewinella sp.]|nr:DUF3078 domain-containing protein [Lewinella sp.]